MTSLCLTLSTTLIRLASIHTSSGLYVGRPEHSEWYAYNPGARRVSKVHAVEDQGSRRGSYYQDKRTLCGAVVPDFANAAVLLLHRDSVDCKVCRKAMRNLLRRAP